MPMQKVKCSCRAEKGFSHIAHNNCAFTWQFIDNRHIDRINERIPGLMLSQRQIISQMIVEAYEQGRREGVRETFAFISKEEGWEDSELHYMKKLGLSDNPN